MSRRIVIHNHLPKRKTKDSWKAEVIADSSGQWVGNALRFATKQEADTYGNDLASRWTSVRSVRSTESSDPVSYHLVGGRAKPLNGVHDATFSNQNTWEAAVKRKYPTAEIKWNGDQTYTATVSGKEVARFNYGQIRGGNLTAGKGFVNDAKTRDGQKFSNKSKGTLGLPVGEFEVMGKSPGKAMPWGTFSDLTVKDLGAASGLKTAMLLSEMKSKGVRFTIGSRSQDANAKPPFEIWMRNVDKYAYAIAGLSIHDLPDCAFRDWYDNGVNERSAANRCIKSAKSGDSAKDVALSSSEKQRLEDLRVKERTTKLSSKETDEMIDLINKRNARFSSNDSTKDSAPVTPIRLSSGPTPV